MVLKSSQIARLGYQNPMARPSGWYMIQRREGPKFKPKEIALWSKFWGKTYGEWTYMNGESVEISERLKDNLVLRPVGTFELFMEHNRYE